LHTTSVSFLERVAGSLGYERIIRCAEKSRNQSLVVEALAHLDGCRQINGNKQSGSVLLDKKFFAKYVVKFRLDAANISTNRKARKRGSD